MTTVVVGGTIRRSVTAVAVARGEKTENETSSQGGIEVFYDVICMNSLARALGLSPLVRFPGVVETTG